MKKIDPVSFSFSEMTDSVSVQYSADYGDGSGTDICGPREYQLFELDGASEVVVSHTVLVAPDGAIDGTISS